MRRYSLPWPGGGGSVEFRRPFRVLLDEALSDRLCWVAVKSIQTSSLTANDIS